MTARSPRSCAVSYRAVRIALLFCLVGSLTLLAGCSDRKKINAQQREAPREEGGNLGSDNGDDGSVRPSPRTRELKGEENDGRAKDMAPPREEWGKKDKDGPTERSARPAPPPGPGGGTGGC
jgi:hypothetical protein